MTERPFRRDADPARKALRRRASLLDDEDAPLAFEPALLEQLPAKDRRRVGDRRRRPDRTRRRRQEPAAQRPIVAERLGAPLANRGGEAEQRRRALEERGLLPDRLDEGHRDPGRQSEGDPREAS